MRIEDGTGGGYAVEVNEHNQLVVHSITVPHALYTNVHNGDAYNTLINQTPSGIGSCFFYIKNNSDDDLVLTSISLYAASATGISIKIGDVGTPVGGTVNTPANLNAGGNAVADITCLEGSEITGLSGGVTVHDFRVTEAQNRWILSDIGIVIPKNKTLALYAATGGVDVRVVLGFYFHT